MSHWTGVYDATRMTPARDYPVAELYEDLAVGGWHTYEEETARLSRLSQIEWTARPSWKTLVARKIDRTLARIRLDADRPAHSSPLARRKSGGRRKPCILGGRS